jgi:hypothetical protein
MDGRGVGAIVTILLSIPMAAAAREAGSPEPRAVVVRTFNYFGESPRDLQGARGQAEKILREAGIEVSWLNCAVRRGAPDGPARCQEPLGADLMLRIGTAPRNDGTHFVSMGFSLVNAADGQAPYLATVYGDLVASVARAAGVDMSVLLGRAMAHEIGHLLLGTNQHAPAGLMRATWSQTELRHDESADWRFQSDEARTMQASLAHRFITTIAASGG